jgi:hypothetical protein
MIIQSKKHEAKRNSRLKTRLRTCSGVAFRQKWLASSFLNLVNYRLDFEQVFDIFSIQSA